MAFDGTYPRKVREAGVAHTVFVRRARCHPCDITDALLPEFVMRRRLDSTATVGCAVLTRAGIDVPARASRLYETVPMRTQRSWHQRFNERSDDLARRLDSLILSWGDPMPFRPTDKTPPVIAEVARLWRAVRRRTTGDIPPPWTLANVIIGGELLATRVDLPWQVEPSDLRRSRSP